MPTRRDALRLTGIAISAAFLNRFSLGADMPLVDASEKMPFRVTPVIPYLRLYEQTQGSNVTVQK